MSSPLDRLRKKKPNSRRIPICMDPQLVVVAEQAEQRLRDAERKVAGLARPNDDALVELAEAQEAHERAQAAVLEGSEWFLVEALGDLEFEALMDAHKPTPDQAQKARKENGPKAQLAYNHDTFPTALIAACTSLITFGDEDPDTGKRDETLTPLTEEAVEEMRKSGAWNAGERLLLFRTCDQVNSSTSQIAAAGNG